MLKLEEKDYDLDFLFKFSFDFAMLKEILLKLAKSNEDLESRVKNLEKSNKEKDNRISNLEDKLKIGYIPEEKTNSSDEEEYDKTKASKQKKGKDKSKEDDYESKELNKTRSRSIRISRREYDNINAFVSQTVSSDTIRSLLELIKKNTEKINKLDKNLNKKIMDSFNDLQKKIKDIDSQNAKEHKIIEAKIKDLYNRLHDYNDRMDGIIVKTAPLDNLVMFKDNGNGTVDATKVMIQMLEEKITKKIEIVEKKGGGGGGEANVDNSELKQKIEELEGLIDQINKEIEFLKQNNMNDYNIDDSLKELRDLIDKKNKDLLAIIEELSNKLKKGEFAGEKMDDILNNIKTEKDKKEKVINSKSTKKINRLDEKEMAEAN